MKEILSNFELFNSNKHFVGYNTKMDSFEYGSHYILSNNDDIDINTIAHFFKEIDLTSQYKYSTKKILYHTIGKYYKELYAKLGIQSLDAAPELTSKESLLIHG